MRTNQGHAKRRYLSDVEQIVDALSGPGKLDIDDIEVTAVGDMFAVQMANHNSSREILKRLTGIDMAHELDAELALDDLCSARLADSNAVWVGRQV